MLRFSRHLSAPSRRRACHGHARDLAAAPALLAELAAPAGRGCRWAPRRHAGRPALPDGQGRRFCAAGVLEGRGGRAMSTARFHTPERHLETSDMELYNKVFQAFGVSPSQFTHLVGQGSRFKASPGGLLVKGGVHFKKVALIVSGEAVAHKYTPGTSEYGTPLCKYIGKLDAAQEVMQPGDLPTRGSVIGGSALADKQVTTDVYPADVVAATHIEWIEWDLEPLEVLIDAPRWRAVQACFYYMLYVDLLSTLDKERAAKIQVKEVHKDEEVPAPSSRQILQLSAFVAVPFCGFGFADNFIMIVAGDAIDAQFGLKLGLTTLASAGLGNWMSDVVGLGLGDAIERAAQKMGISDGNLTPAQEKLRIARITTSISKIVGITVGCFLGMLPLLVLTPSKKEFAMEDLSLYDEVFGPNGVSTQQFADLMERGTKHWAAAGATVLKGGAPLGKVYLLLRGELDAHPHQPGGGHAEGKPVCMYVGRLGNDEPSTRGANRSVPVRGSIIGGTAFGDPSVQGGNYPNDLIACKNVEWIEWDFEELAKLLKEEKAIEASFFSMLYTELIQTLSKDSKAKQFETYKLILYGVLADGVVAKGEREFVQSQREKLRISDEDHFRFLSELGWSEEAWERGSLPGGPQHQLTRTNTGRQPWLSALRSPTSDRESVAHLQHAVSLIEGVMRSIESGGDK